MNYSILQYTIVNYSIHTEALTLFILSNKGMRTNLMNPICAVGFVTLSRSMKGATGSPSDFSLSLCIKYSSRRQSTHGSETSIGRTSLEMSQHLISIICSWRRKKEVGLREVQISKMCSREVLIHLCIKAKVQFAA